MKDIQRVDICINRWGGQIMESQTQQRNGDAIRPGLKYCCDHVLNSSPGATRKFSDIRKHNRCACSHSFFNPGWKIIVITWIFQPLFHIEICREQIIYECRSHLLIMKHESVKVASCRYSIFIYRTLFIKIKTRQILTDSLIRSYLESANSFQISRKDVLM